MFDLNFDIWRTFSILFKGYWCLSYCLSFVKNWSLAFELEIKLFTKGFHLIQCKFKSMALTFHGIFEGVSDILHNCILNPCLEISLIILHLEICKQNLTKEAEFEIRIQPLLLRGCILISNSNLYFIKQFYVTSICHLILKGKENLFVKGVILTFFPLYIQDILIP